MYFSNLGHIDVHDTIYTQMEIISTANAETSQILLSDKTVNS